MFKRISIIIPTLNEEKHIYRCLLALSKLEKKEIALEVFVIDNGSSDKTVEIAERFGAEVIIKKGVNVAALRNLGVEISEGELIGFVDADCEVSQDWLTKAVECMVACSADAVGSFYVIPEETGWIGLAADLIQKKKMGGGFSYFPAGNMVVKRSSFCSVNGFDESLETSEDVDLCHRLKQKGFKLVMDPNIRSLHWGAPGSIKILFKKEIWHGKMMCTIFLRDLLAVRNLGLVIYSGLNLLFVFLLFLGGLYFISKGKPFFFYIGTLLFLSLNLLVMVIKDYSTIRKKFLPLFGYSVIYGLARSYSMLKWILNHIYVFRKR